MLVQIAYREKNVRHVHEAQNGVPNFRLVVSVACKEKNRGNNMMGEHLVVVFPPLFDIDHYDLLKPERKLYKIIPFEQPIKLSIGPADPQFTVIKPVARVVHQVLYEWSVSTSSKSGNVVLPSLVTRKQ